VWRRVLDAAPSLLLAGVALLHATPLGPLGTLPPDKGGGFGLFSTVDRLDNRLLAVYARDAAGRERRLPLRPDPALRAALRRALAQPGRGHLEAVAERVAEALRAEARRRGRRPAASALRVEVSRLAFRDAGPRLRREPLASVLHPLDAPGGRTPLAE